MNKDTVVSKDKCMFKKQRIRLVELRDWPRL